MKNKIIIAIFVTGLSGLIGQMILLREMLIIFSGNELTIGIILANWLLMEAFGSYFLGKKAEISKNKIITYTIYSIIFSVSLPTMIYIIRMLKNILDISMLQGIGITTIFFSSFLIMIPVSVFHGALFTYGCKIYSTYLKDHSESIGKTYIYETLGTIIGGLLWTFLLIPFFNSLYISITISTINILICVILIFSNFNNKNIYKIFYLSITILLFLFGTYLLFTEKANELHEKSIKLQWAPQNIIHYENSKFGNISVIEKESQYTFFLDGVLHLETPTPDILFIEEFVNIPILTHPNPKDILILSGGAGGLINEILKHPYINQIQYIELDPELIRIIEKYPTELTNKELTNEKVQIINIDGRLYLRKTQNEYDLIYIGIKELTDLQTNRFFTENFFQIANKKLNTDGILVFGIPGSLRFLSNEIKNLNSSIYNSVKIHFEYIRVIPGEETNIFLASNSNHILNLNTDIMLANIRERNLQTTEFIPRNIDYKLHPGWFDWYLEFLENGSEKINRDFHPIGVYYSVSHWNSLLSPSISKYFSSLDKLNLFNITLFFIIIYIILLILKLTKIKIKHSGISLCIGTSGFTGMILDLSLIFIFQAIYGYLFNWIGLLVTSFMVGSAVGSLIILKYLKKMKNKYKSFISIEILIIIYIILIPIIFILFTPHINTITLYNIFRIIILFLSFFSGLLIGMQFPLANHIYLTKNKNLSKSAGLFYSSDLIGGWLGGIIGGIILLPILGLLGTGLFTFLLKLTSLLIFLLNKKIIL